MRSLFLLLAASALAVDPTIGKKIAFSDDFNGDAVDETKWTLPGNRDTVSIVKGGKDKALRISLRMSLRIRMSHAAATSTVAPGAVRGIVLRSASTGQTTSASVRR